MISDWIKRNTRNGSHYTKGDRKEIGKDRTIHCPRLVRYAGLAWKFEVYFTTDPALKKHPRI